MSRYGSWALTAAVLAFLAVISSTLQGRQAAPAATSPSQVADQADAAHEALFNMQRFPSATMCGACHPTH